MGTQTEEGGPTVGQQIGGAVMKGATDALTGGNPAGALVNTLYTVGGLLITGYGAHKAAKMRKKRKERIADERTRRDQYKEDRMMRAIAAGTIMAKKQLDEGTGETE